MGTLITITQFFLSLSILVVLHECGHFFPAKWFKTKVEKFYLFFDPGFSLFKIQKGDTEYGVGWLPFGGYVKISGMIDESFDKEQMAGPPQPWEFRSKPAWQRLIIMLGGVTVNFILGILIFSAIFFSWGDAYLPNENATYGIAVEELGEVLGLKDGDKLISVGGEKVEKLFPNQIVKDIVINEARTLTVLRNGREQRLIINDESAKALSSYENKDKDIYVPRMPIIIAKLAPDMPASNSGIQLEDQILAVNGFNTFFYDQFVDIAENLKNQSVILSVLRGGDTLSIATQFNENGKLGFNPYSWNKYFDSERNTYGVGESLVAGWNRSFDFLNSQLKAFGQMFRGKMDVKESVGGPIAIAGMFGNTWDWLQFWNLTASLSIILAFMNLLPIPGLDGGHVIFLLWEIITGRKASDQVVEYATLVGFALLMTMMAAIFWIDLSRLF